MNMSPDASATRIIEEKSGTKEIEMLLSRVREKEGTEKVLDETLNYLGEMPFDKYQNYGDFRHKGLRGYLINLFFCKKSRAAIRGSD